jgi:hypothetical protein
MRRVGEMMAAADELLKWFLSFLHAFSAQHPDLK